MSEGERGAMIRSMVQRLAGRLKENPDDEDGWRRLARAYEVLGETEKAKDAIARADALAK
jgi:cytochrome c-type biogenesis protein CcmH